ncbi:P-loop containing nucleoside triphosphate hydrolase protein [Fimicolochytrium jonesii]|uniref:P-loop containing nucleoside triphosphate hydrolase protein n=1 Tax=Fimicolochytrium jonesii TaxID=1396493 RepID=UPI0022FECB33|nr:P-loop containing nucleoside triphosphate hydrolase protein [Fimicolochytrium jonesii]KAI8816054.1 P-loop containing nucleoside triphosphate hydrolase protein [Fimicolochytrium jonesii]
MVGPKFTLGSSFDPLAIPTIEDDDDVPMLDLGDEDNSAEDAVVGEESPEESAAQPEPEVEAKISAKLTKKEKQAAKKAEKLQKQKQKLAEAKAKTGAVKGAAAQSAKAAGTKPAKAAAQKTAASVPVEDEEKLPDLNPDFSFETDGGSLRIVDPAHPWDFTAVKAAIKANMKDTTSTSVDDKIARKRKEVADQLKAAKKQARAESAEVDSDNEELSGDDADVDGMDLEAASDDEDADGVLEDGASESEADDDEGDENEEGQEDEVVISKRAQPASNGKGKRGAQKDDEESEGEDLEDVVQEKRKAAYFAPTPVVDDSFEIDSFQNLRLSRPVLRNIQAMNFTKPTSIQARAIPIALQGSDICGSAVTGSGKTAAFMIPIIERLLYRSKNIAASRVLVLVPTRELGVQCHAVGERLAQDTGITFCLAVGGLNGKVQAVELGKRPDVIIATPGRLIDHLQNSKNVSLDSIEILVMDEADRMLEDGFAAELNEIIKNTPKSRQTMLFSATMTDNVDDLIKLSLNRPVRLFVDAATSIASKLVQEFIRVRAHRETSRPALLAALCTRTYKQECIVFFRSKAAAHHMQIIFGLLGLKAAELHGNLTQLQRLEALDRFRAKEVDFLLATDLASRGLDIAGIRTVINYDMPKNYPQYVHRIGRTARGGAGGCAVSLVGEADRQVLKLAVKNSRDEVKQRVVPSTVVQRFEIKIDGFKDAVKEIYAEEAEEKELRKADMQITRMQNMMEHEDEIKSRPAKTWFQTAKEKEEEKQKGLDRHNANFDGVDAEGGAAGGAGRKRKAGVVDDAPKPKRGKFDGLNRKQKRSALARAEDTKELASQARSAHLAKKSARPHKISSVPTPSTAHSNPNQKRKKASGFESEMVAGKKRRGEEKGKKPVKDKGGEKGGDKSKERGERKLGKLKGVKAFKSKAKHRRR